MSFVKEIKRKQQRLFNEEDTNSNVTLRSSQYSENTALKIKLGQEVKI